MNRTIVTLCGSTHFWRTFQRASLYETERGRAVFSIGAATGTDDEHFGNLPAERYFAIKDDLDALHLDKIAMSHEIIVLNEAKGVAFDYVGPSTQRELAHARALGKRVRWWNYPSRHALPGEVAARPELVEADLLPASVAAVQGTG